MKGQKMGKLFFIALAAMWANSTAEDFVCGTPDEAVTLTSSADQMDLPKISKVWKGKLKALVLRISYSDAPYAVTEANINTTNEAINVLYRSMSRNTFEWDWKIHPTTFNAPGTTASYTANWNSLQSYISQQISAAGLVRCTATNAATCDYDVYVASFPKLNLGWAGMSNMRDADWINGSYSSGVTSHELGHSVSLPHAHSIEAGTDMFGTPGTSSQTNEYGNPFDVMGRGGNTAHFGTMYKWRIGWEDADEIIELKNNGTYRIYAHDNADHKARLLGIRVPSGNPAYAYWFEYRTVNTSARLGATVTFQGFTSATNLDNWFLDATPGSKTSGDESDGVLGVGKEFKDKYGQGTFKVLAVSTGVTGAEAWVDLQVNIPGVSVFPGKQVNLLHPGWQTGSPVFYVAGRKVDGHAAQVLALRNTGNGPRLILQQP